MRKIFLITIPLMIFVELMLAQKNFNLSLPNENIYPYAYFLLGINKDNFFYLGTKDNKKNASYKLLDYDGQILAENDSLVDMNYPQFYIYKNSIKKIDDNRFIFIANRATNLTQVYEFNTLQQRIIYKTFLFRHSESAIAFSAILPLLNNHFLTIEYDNSSFSNLQTIFTEYDENWKKLKEISVRDSLDHSYNPVYVEQLADSSILTVGEYINREDPLNPISRQFIRIYDTKFKIKVQRLLDVKKYLLSSYGTILQDHKSNYLVSAESYFKHPDSSIYDNESLIVNIDTSFEKVLWITKLYNPIPNSNLHLFNAGMFKSSKADEFYTYGNFATNSNGDRVNSYVYKFRDNGDSIWMKTFEVISLDSNQIIRQQFLDGKLTLQNKLLFIGTYADNKSSKDHPWLLQIDEDGCLVPDCNKVSTYNMTKFKIDVYPTLITDNRVFFKSNNENSEHCVIKLYNLNGQLLHQVHSMLNNEVQYILNLPLTIPAGEYILQFEIKGEQVFNQKINMVKK